jgi:chaperonin GroEL
LRTLSDNAGLECSIVVAKVLDGEGPFGLNVETGEYEDLIKAGVIDPAKVTRAALQNAASVAGLLLTTEALVSEIPEKTKAPAMPPGGDMGGMDGMGGMGGMGGGMGGMGGF